jgi:(5-formylfuran-3-yl)methyl phosphate synthase
MITPYSSTRFLASVRSVGEAHICARSGADVIDCKDPNAGALGALPLDTVRAICDAVGNQCCVSATVGDLVSEPQFVTAAVSTMAATGVAYVKIGFFPGGDALATIRALGNTRISSARLVGLLLADRNPDFSLIRAMADARFAGVMLDTSDKSGTALPDVLPGERLEAFISVARQAGLFAGLAGSLQLNHVPPLLALKPELLGFRGALCRAGDRRGVLDPDAVLAVRDAIPAVPSGTRKQHKVLI